MSFDTDFVAARVNHPATVTPMPSPKNLPTGRIVAIDDDPMTLRLLDAHLSKAGHKIKTAKNGTEGLKLIDDNTSVALVDLKMPDLTGFQVLQYIQEHHRKVQVIVLTGSEETSDAVDAMRGGAFQFITKPFDPNELVVYVEKAIAAWQVADENTNLKESHSQNVLVRDMDSTGDVHSRLMQQVEQVAALNSTIFIGGETGTGKSTIARMIHQKSNRSKGPFVTVNCASLPRDLIQSELFGHTKGSFTGAIKDRIGHAEVADGGTLFLDEIGDLPLELQPKLLTFLQDRTVQRLGSTQTRKVDVRLIAATHCDLASMCRDGLFRQDLYFRLLVLNLELPALRFRLGEFEIIALNILTGICERQAIEMKSISSQAMELLKGHSWPGNIRELENVLERATAFSQNSSIQSEDLFFNNVSLDQRAQGVSGVGKVNSNPIPAKRPIENSPRATEASIQRESITPVRREPAETLVSQNDESHQSSHYQLAGKTLAQIERDAIIQTLEMLNGNKAKTARTLGISEKSIYNKMKRLKITS